MNITAQMVKELRDKTGAGMMDAKKALVETDGDMEKAMEVLRQKGMASADKKMGRIAAEGVVTSSIQDNCGAMVELNCETDFVAKTKNLKNLLTVWLNLLQLQTQLMLMHFLLQLALNSEKLFLKLLKKKSLLSAKKLPSEDLFVMKATLLLTFTTVKSVF